MTTIGALRMTMWEHAEKYPAVCGPDSARSHDCCEPSPLSLGHAEISQHSAHSPWYTSNTSVLIEIAGNCAIWYIHNTYNYTILIYTSCNSCSASPECSRLVPSHIVAVDSPAPLGSATSTATMCGCYHVSIKTCKIVGFRLIIYRTYWHYKG